MHRRPVSRRPIAWAIALAVLLPTAAGTVPALGATAGELKAARERIDRTSAELAQARSRAERTGGDELAALERIERRLQAQKAELLQLESGLAAQHAAEGAATEPAADAPGTIAESPAAEASDDPLIVLADAPGPAAAAAPVTTVTGQSAQEVVPAVTGPAAELTARIDGYLASKASPLTGLGAVFVTEGNAVGLDPRFLVAISGAETSFGTYGPSQGIHNPFGMGPGISYPSWSAAIAAAARNLGGPIYAGDGRVTIGTIQQRWAPAGASNDPTDLNSNWARNVATYYAELGGDPQGAVFTGASTVAAAAAAAPGVQQESCGRDERLRPAGREARPRRLGPRRPGGPAGALGARHGLGRGRPRHGDRLRRRRPRLLVLPPPGRGGAGRARRPGPRRDRGRRRRTCRPATPSSSRTRPGASTTRASMSAAGSSSTPRARTPSWASPRSTTRSTPRPTRGRAATSPRRAGARLRHTGPVRAPLRLPGRRRRPARGRRGDRGGRAAHPAVPRGGARASRRPSAPT